MFSFTRYSLARQFLTVSLIILLIGMLVIGYFVSIQIKTGVINQAAIISALYIESFVAPIVQEMPIEEAPDGIHPTNSEHLASLNRLLTDTPLGKNIVAFKLWLSDGEIIYSPNEKIVGVHFSINERLNRALNGEIVSEISKLEDHEHIYERLYWDTLIETYSPIRSKETGEIIAVAEFYILPDDLNAEIRAAQIRSLVIVGASTIVMYLLLAGIVGRASQTIFNQQGELQGNINQLKDLLSQNEHLRKRVHRAAGRTTSLNEKFLRRISSDLHDGPTQNLALALLRIDPLADAVIDNGGNTTNQEMVIKDIATIQNSLESSITDIRAISAGLRIPDLENFSPKQVALRAIKDYQRKTNRKVSIELQDTPVAATESVKITLYRLIQEGLTNSFRHANCTIQLVKMHGDNNQVVVEIEDDGIGFDLSTVDETNHLGLAVMRERVEVLGGDFKVITNAPKGTKIIACFPLSASESNPEVHHD